MTLPSLAALAAVLLAGQSGSSNIGHAEPWQASKVMCRPAADSRQSSPPRCRGAGASRLEVQPACFCEGLYTRFDEPACHADGSPAIFPAGHEVTAAEDARLVSCRDVRRPAGRR